MNIEFIPATTAAFIGGLSDSDMQRVIDEALVGTPLVNPEDGCSVAKLSAALAHLYLATEDLLTRQTRLLVIGTILHRVLKRKDAEDLLSLKGPLNEVEWSVVLSATAEVNLDGLVWITRMRMERVSQAEEKVVEDPEIMGGQPVFQRTRAPIALVLGALDAGEEFDRLRQAYPFLTTALIDDARLYRKIHSPIGHPAKAEARTEETKLISRKRVPLNYQQHEL